MCLRPNLLSGWTGGLGHVAARELVEGGASRLVLASRTPALPAAAATSLVSSSGCSVLLASCDVGEPAAVRAYAAAYGAVVEQVGSAPDAPLGELMTALAPHAEAFERADDGV